MGGTQTAWTAGTDAMCLSAETTPRPVGYGVAPCQSATSEASCALLLSQAGCEYSIGLRNSML